MFNFHSSKLWEKLIFSLVGGMIFIALSNKQLYEYIDKSTGDYGVYAVKGCPTFIGHISNTIIFFILILSLFLVFNFLKEKDSRYSFWSIFKKSIDASLIFYFVSNKELYKLINKIPYFNLADNKGCPDMDGILVNSLIYMFTFFSVSIIPSK